MELSSINELLSWVCDKAQHCFFSYITFPSSFPFYPKHCASISSIFIWTCEKKCTNKHVKGWHLSFWAPVCVSTHGPRAFGCTGRCCGLRLRPVCRPALGRCSWWTSPALAAPPVHVWWWYSASLPILEEEEEDRRGKLYLNSSLPNLVDMQHILCFLQKDIYTPLTCLAKYVLQEIWLLPKIQGSNCRVDIVADGWLKKAENVYAETGICNFLLQINTKKDFYFFFTSNNEKCSASLKTIAYNSLKCYFLCDCVFC